MERRSRRPSRRRCRRPFLLSPPPPPSLQCHHLLPAGRVRLPGVGVGARKKHAQRVAKGARRGAAGGRGSEGGTLGPTNPNLFFSQTLIDKLVSCIIYWAVGFAFAYGDSAGGVVGVSHFFLARATPTAMAVWFNSWTFLITATTIVSGCLAERAAFEAYLAYTPLMAGAVFPLAVH